MVVTILAALGGGLGILWALLGVGGLITILSNMNLIIWIIGGIIGLAILKKLFR